MSFHITSKKIRIRDQNHKISINIDWIEALICQKLIAVIQDVPRYYEYFLLCVVIATS